ncbi:acyl-CoA dehydrogenase family protein [Streptomyces sp. NPDC047928]|uniref:acyl-CoA dehydrogenase family protein n=1 Tax=unclassified Streptomyces TaxID=2593676 RepID=UPI00371104EB
MDAAFTPEQDAIRRTLRDLLAAHCGPDAVRAAATRPTGYDPALWALLAGRLGLPGIAVPEEYGGVGCGPAELVLACEETGRVLAPSPLLATSVLAAPLIALLGTEAQRAELLPRIADGSLTATLAVPAGADLPTALDLVEARPSWSGGGRAGGIQARPAPGGDGWTLYGEADRVLDGHSAGLLLVAAHTGGFARSRTRIFLIRPEAAPGLTRVRRTSLDQTRPLARVQLRDSPARLLGGGGGKGVGGDGGVGGKGGVGGDGDVSGDVGGALQAVGQLLAAALAAEATGAAAHCLERTLAHVRTREQFGRPIGSFQAVKHRLADLYVQVQSARSAAYYAAWDRTAGGLALAQCLEALHAVAADTIQLHGGIGFTWEHEAHLYFKRATADQLLFGPVHRLRARAAHASALFGGTLTEVAR